MSEIPPQVEIWKKVVDVQQHFNDLELRVRNFAIVVTGAFIGLGGYAIKDGGMASICGITVSVSGLVVFCSLFPLAAFYLMDRLWYHRMLEGAVNAATPVEARLRELGMTVELGTKIRAASPFELRGHKVHSKHKMDGFYLLTALGILALSSVLAFGVRPVSNQTHVEPPALRLEGASDKSTTNVIKPSGLLHSSSKAQQTIDDTARAN